MGIKRLIETSFWTDGKVDDFTPEDKYFMLYILTNPFTTQLGIYELSIKQAAFQMGYSVEAFTNLLDRFENKYHLLKYNQNTHEIAIKNFLRHSVVSGGKPVEDCINREIIKVKDKSLIDYVFSSIVDKEDLNVTVKKVIFDYKKNNDNDNDNDNENDNENESAVDESYHESSSARTTNRPAHAKHKYGEYKNVLLSDKELEKLKERFTDWEERIENLSLGIESKGYKYKNHYATILNWARRDKEKNNSKARKGSSQLDDFYAMAADFSERGQNE